MAGTYWYVPITFLPAMQMNATDGTPMQMTDQTVWQITGYKDGYFWGNCAVLIYETGTSPVNPPGSFRIAGSVTPEGNVQMSFMPLIELGASMSTSGWGKIIREKETVFEMQMGSGVTDIVVHWALMAQTAEGEPSWNQLPGTGYSVPEFLQAAGF